MNTTELWTQIHQLQFGFMDAKVGALVESHIGRMVRHDKENNHGSWRRFMRVLVEIVGEEPLQQDLVIEREEGANIKLVFKFEKLGKFCFICGAIGHMENFCSDKFESSSASSKKKKGGLTSVLIIIPLVVVTKWRVNGLLVARVRILVDGRRKEHPLMTIKVFIK